MSFLHITDTKENIISKGTAGYFQIGYGIGTKIKFNKSIKVKSVGFWVDHSDLVSDANITIKIWDVTTKSVIFSQDVLEQKRQVEKTVLTSLTLSSEKEYMFSFYAQNDRQVLSGQTTNFTDQFTKDAVTYTCSGMYYNKINNNEMPSTESTLRHKIYLKLEIEDIHPISLTLKDKNNINVPITKKYIKADKNDFLLNLNVDDTDMNSAVEYSILVNGITVKSYTPCNKGMNFTDVIPYSRITTGNNQVQIKARNNMGTETILNFTLIQMQTLSLRDLYNVLISL